MNGKDLNSSGVPRISQAMIVKNEENNIRTALSWGKDIFSEQIVVDTGSTDSTADIAKEMGARVFHIPWKNDFAWAKNQAIERCSGDWIALLDADEYVAPEDVPKIPELIERCEREHKDVLEHSLMHLSDGGAPGLVQTQIRFFRNRSDIRYVRPIHEQLMWKGGTARIYDGTKELCVLHTGFMGENARKKSGSKRNYNIMKAILEKTPDDAEILGYLADECFDSGEIREAVSWYRKSIRQYQMQHLVPTVRLSLNYVRLMECLAAVGADRILFTRNANVPETLLNLPEKDETCTDNAGSQILQMIGDVYREAVQIFPKEPDIPCVYGMLLYSHGDYEGAADHLSEALQKLGAYGMENQAIFTAGHLPDLYIQAADALYRTGNDSAAYPIARDAACTIPDAYQALTVWLSIMKAWREKNVFTAAEEKQQIEQNYGTETLKKKLFLRKAAQDIGDHLLENYVLQNMSPEEREALENLDSTGQKK